ncbi:hypothetical protein MSG28_000195 [Choristoneura fumiferana]|uniref:Uncharacterized protein n=1 Tax=Choristoneura fumiferana TaxID=7141 RepID=A0ACC0JZI4_CHOFU|nr:hypothetical protein MSG28_000195 [Choristoneura fumiferana]
MMDASKINKNSEARSKPKVVKVVKLKRFMPKMDAKRLMCFNHIDAHAPNHCTENVDCNTGVLEDPIVNEKEPKNEIDNPSNFEDGSSSSETGLIDHRKPKIIIKGCCHTTEELTKLTEHYDETLVELGNVFESREAFRKYINDNAKRWSYYYVCRTSKKNLLEYNCICMAYKLKPKAHIIRKQKKRTTACPCKIRLAVDQDTKKVAVYYVCNHHDHDLTESAFYQYPHAKYLPQEVKDVILDLAYLGLETDLIQKYIHSLVGLTIKRRHIASYAYKFKRKTMQRNLTVERRQYIKDLIATIRGAYKETMDVALKRDSEKDSHVAHGIKSNNSEQCKRRKSQGNAKDDKNNSLDTTIDDDVNIKLKGPGDANVFDNLLDSNVDLNNHDVIVQYINDEGVLCEQNGAPVTNSSAIMQLITNYENTMAVSNMKDGFLEEGTGFSELVENITDNIYTLDWRCVQETQAEIEEVNIKSTEDVVAANGNMVVATADCELDPDQDMKSNNRPRITVLSDSIVNCDKSLSPTHAGPAVYADMDIFNKYYFVDHQYIKYESGNSNDLTQRANKETQINRYSQKCMTKEAINCQEYIKAPDSEDTPPPLRICLGHDDLTMLSDADVILPGAKFLTHQVFLKYINERASRWFFYYSLVESGKVPEFYVYKCVFGKHRASKNAYQAKGLRKRAKLTTQCPCQIRLRRLNSEPTYLTVVYSCNHHDHPLDAQLFNAQPHSRRLPEHIKEEIKDLLFLGAKSDLLRKYVTSETGLRIYDKYFHNVRTVQGQAEKRRRSSRNTSQTGTSRKHGRLEKRLKNLSSHEETLLKVKKLQESCVVWWDVSYEGATELHFCQQTVKVKAQEYQAYILECVDGFISKEEWPSQSSDLNLLDYSLWTDLELKACRKSPKFGLPQASPD